MDATPEQVQAGHAFYTRRSLAVHDLAILGYFSRMAWKCRAGRPTQAPSCSAPGLLHGGVDRNWLARKVMGLFSGRT